MVGKGWQPPFGGVWTALPMVTSMNRSAQAGVRTYRSIGSRIKDKLLGPAGETEAPLSP